MRILVAIANYGFKHAEYLQMLIQEYKSMPCDTDIVVLSNVPKELESNIEVVVGLPTRDPWSLPFGHRKIFAERINNYDLFIYSEDDILLTWKNIESFLLMSKVLPEGDIAGFMLYEIDSMGKKWYPSFRDSFHWVANSVKRVDNFTLASFSNLHSACYVLTRDQLKRAIRLGGYLVDPHQGKYDLLCSAATDPYTQCGFRKVICISSISDFLAHHLTNRYAGEIGINEEEFEMQIAFMLSSQDSPISWRELFPIAKNIDDIRWDKVYYGPCDYDLLSLVSSKAKHILFVGCGYPSSEAILVRKGLNVAAIPLDPIIGMLAASKGIRVTEPDFEQAFRKLDGSKFDCILFPDVLQHLKDPGDIISRAIKLLAIDGQVLVSIPNFNYLKFFKERFPYPVLKRWTYSKNLLHVVTKRHIEKWFQSNGLKMTSFQYAEESRILKRLRIPSMIFKCLATNRILAAGKI
jgi:2-polyprenyl-3-methyl-5-hydroxy-6-metoxy-1,4-benzoquinol methylase